MHSLKTDDIEGVCGAALHKFTLRVGATPEYAIALSNLALSTSLDFTLKAEDPKKLPAICGFKWLEEIPIKKRIRGFRLQGVKWV